jgi:hypothetical protein
VTGRIRSAPIHKNFGCSASRNVGAFNAACLETPARWPGSALTAARCAPIGGGLFGPHPLSGSPACAIRGWPDTNDPQRPPLRQFEGRDSPFGQGQIEQSLVPCPIRAQYGALLRSLTANHGQHFPLHVRKLPSQSPTVLVFQAGHASSILVTRSMAIALVRGSLPRRRLELDQRSIADVRRPTGHRAMVSYSHQIRSGLPDPWRPTASVPQVVESFIVSVLLPGGPGFLR